MSFTMLDPGPAADSRVGRIMDVVTAKYLGAYEGNMKMKKHSAGGC